MEDPVRLRPATLDDHKPVTDLIFHVFHDPATDELRELEYLITEFDRSTVAEESGTVVGHTTAQTRDLTTPGGMVAAAHVTGVGVAPTHRRRGILTALMRHQLTEIAAAGREPVAALWASETSIYPRFGYGPAASRLVLDIMTREVRLTSAPPTGRLRLVDPTEALPELIALYERVRADRVGWSSRPEHLWRYRLSDNSVIRKSATFMHGVICDGPDGPQGYALWRSTEGWNRHGPNAKINVRELVATDQQTYATLWQFLLSIDLARSAAYDYAAVDEPLLYMVDEPRRLGASHADALWVRLVDLPAALEARAYATPLDVVLQVTDPILAANEGRWRLSGVPGKVTCTRTDDPADLACSITELGAAYLGGTSLAALAAAGRVQRLTDNFPATAFSWPRSPNPIEVF